MDPVSAIVYIGGALGYAACVTALFFGLAWGLNRRPSNRIAWLVLAVAFPVFLGLHPFPDPASFDCRQSPRPLLRPFGYLDMYRLYWDQGRPPGAWLTSRSIMAPLMNVALFAPAGLALSRLTGAWRHAVMLGLGLGVFIEIAQVTALFGIYPCPYRQFETNDLILNLVAVCLGFGLGRALLRSGR